MLQIVFTILLTGVLLVAVVTFVVIALAQAHRTRSLRRESRQMGLRFSADDPFDVPRRYADFTLIGSGHSPRACNVTYGRLDGRFVRAFDFRYEVGHGTRRVTRHYKVIVLEATLPGLHLLMWNDDDTASAPLCARAVDGHVASWSYRGGGELAASLAHAQSMAAGQASSFEIGPAGLMIFTPARRLKMGCAERLADGLKVMCAVEACSQKTRPAGQEHLR